jgi:hypothetical protein
MFDKFTQMAEHMATNLSRRAALRKFGLGLSGVILASWGFSGPASARNGDKPNVCRRGCTRACHDSCGNDNACFAGCFNVCYPSCRGR